MEEKETVMGSVLYDIRRKMQVLGYRVFGAKTMSKLYFVIVLHQKLNLKVPKTFNEKIQWYKLNFCPFNKQIVICSDKYRIREYLKEKHLESYQMPLIGVWDSPEEIQWDSLPRQFVLKCNHGCAYNIICRDKDILDIDSTKKKLNRWMREDFGEFNAEVHYSLIEPVIVCEEYLEDKKIGELVDYKVHCFNGVAKFLMVCSERKGNKANYNYYDFRWNRLPYSNTEVKEFSKPDTIEEMYKISSLIAADFPFVRVDFYSIEGKLYIGELTFVPAGGLDDTLPHDADISLGNMLDLGEWIK